MSFCLYYSSKLSVELIKVLFNVDAMYLFLEWFIQNKIKIGITIQTALKVAETWGLN